MRIKKWKIFIKEAISGWELVGKHTMGPNYPEQELRTTISQKDTNVICGIDGEFYTESDYIETLYPQYLKINPDKPLFGFNKQNLDIVITELSNEDR